MCTSLAPLHLLPFAEAFAYHLVHGRLHKTCGYYLAVTIPLAIIRNEVAVVGDVGAEFLHGFSKLLELWVRLFAVVDQRLDSIYLVQGLVEIPMPQRPLEPLEL